MNTMRTLQGKAGLSALQDVNVASLGQIGKSDTEWLEKQGRRISADPSPLTPAPGQ